MAVRRKFADHTTDQQPHFDVSASTKVGWFHHGFHNLCSFHDVLGIDISAASIMVLVIVSTAISISAFSAKLKGSVKIQSKSGQFALSKIIRGSSQQRTGIRIMA
ncbi:hypothetical protein JTE90_024398 [Oedothorax gibbosus]|uniref:Uncharacterized protein n=1 Tax=Oedothorax gibbosus TaxID=931172 RepID=A0AAV6TTE5_9ARAC|nr:hypothetical protein JTE90_024398 [Oedothorax gibbosus]